MENRGPRANDDGTSLVYWPKRAQTRMRRRSTQRMMSKLPSRSALYAAMRATATVAASWSKPSAMSAVSDLASAHARAIVVTRSRYCPDECRYTVVNWMSPCWPAGIAPGAVATTSKNTATVVCGWMALSRHAHVPPIPISVSPIETDFLPVEVTGPMAPHTLRSREVCTSSTPENACTRSPASSCRNTRLNDSRNSDVANESPRTMSPPERLTHSTSSRSPVWLPAHANMSIVCPLCAMRLPSSS
eukprot:Amastigsp_a340775_33.p3 type:complete len:246 gc:universal Amastigsp_a340775_33:875-138(-)